MFGVATADHQAEAFDPRYPDIRDVWDERKKLTLRGRATDFWNRYPEDVRLAKEMGCKAFRLSIAWARVEPEPGVYNDEAFAHYADVIRTVREAGMEPMVTLHHFVWPIHVESRGGLISPDFPSIFADYTTEVVKRLGKDVRYWVTFNEPSILLLGFIKPWWQPGYVFPPGLPPEATMSDQVEAVHQLMRNLFLAHTAARAVIKESNPQAMVGSNPSILGLPLWLHRLVNRNAARVRTHEDWVKSQRRFAERSLLERGEVDMLIATLTMTPQRAEQMEFSRPYYIAGQTILVTAQSTVAGRDDLRRQAVGVIKTSTAESTINTLIPSANARSFADYPSALKALDDGQVAALLADNTILLGYVQKNPGKYRFVGEPLTREPYAVAVANGNRELSEAVNNAVLGFIESGEWAESYQKHFPGEPVPPLPESALQATLSDINLMGEATMARMAESLTVEAGKLPLAPARSLLRRIQKRGHIVVAVKQDVPGFSFQDPQTREWSGLEIDIARAIALYIFNDASKVVFHSCTTKERIPLLRSFFKRLDPVLQVYSILSSAFITNWWHLGMAGKLPEFLCPAECVGQFDYIGFDYYWGISSIQLGGIRRLLDALAFGRFDQAPVWAKGLHVLLKYHGEMFPGKEIWIVENGSVVKADGISRARYLRDHICEVQRAASEGVNVQGYICWSITSNREWGLTFGEYSNFGLYHIDLETDPDLKRQPTEASAYYRKVISKRGT
jgi:beta-glucosidase/6-phospho-beta-glucosidase/beta-galactosidase/ABC-type amino acid transport substrate-binding protein